MLATGARARIRLATNGPAPPSENVASLHAAMSSLSSARHLPDQLPRHSQQRGNMQGNLSSNDYATCGYDPIAPNNELAFIDAIWEVFSPLYTGIPLRSRIHHRANRNHPLSQAQAQANANRQKSKVRARIEHVFGAQQNSPGGRIVRTIGIARAKAKIGLQNLAYNIRRLVTLERMAAA
jgi:Transposase DDE domain